MWQQLTSGVLGLTVFSILAAAVSAVSPEPDEPLITTVGADSVQLDHAAEFSSQRVSGRGTAVAPSEAFLEDLRVLSKDSGQEFEDLRVRHKGWREFGAFSQDLSSRFSKIFAGSGHSRQDPGTVWIRFTDRPPREVFEDAAETPYNVEIEWGAAITEAEAGELTPMVMKTLKSAGEVEAAETRLDSETGQIIATVKYGSSATTLEDVARTLAALIPQSVSPGVVIQAGPHLDTRAELALKGGRQLTPGDAAACTAAFSVRKGSDDGLITAAHCYGFMRYEGRPSTIAFVDKAGGRNGGAIDLQWHRTLGSHTTLPAFRYRYTQPYDRTVSYGQNAPIDSMVCHWGFGSNRERCSEVADRDVCYDDFLTGTWCGNTRTRSNVSAGGDSGGPWFSERVVRGVHSGGSGFLNTSCYVPWTQFHESVGLVIVSG